MRYFLVAICMTLCTVLYCQDMDTSIPQGSLTLEKASQSALNKYPSIDDALSSIQNAYAIVEQNRSSLYPTVTASVSSFYRNQTVQPDWATDSRADIEVYDSNLNLQAQWLVFDGFARKARILSARKNVESSQQHLYDVQRLLLKSVATAYYQGQLALQNMDIAKSNLQFNRKLENEMKQRYEVGDAPEANVLNFSLRALQAESSFISARTDFDLACTILAELMGNGEFTGAQEQMPLHMDFNDSSALPDAKTEIDYAIAHRSDLEALRIMADSLGYQKDSIKAQYYPTVALAGGYNYNRMDEIDSVDQEENHTYLGVTASWEIFSGWRRRAQIKSVDSQISSADANIERLALNVRSEIQQLIRRGQALQKVIALQEKACSHTSKIRDYVRMAYQEGEETLTRLNEAQNDLVSTSGSLSASRIQYVLILSDLSAAAGRNVSDDRSKK